MTTQITKTPVNIAWKGLFANSKDKIKCEIEASVKNTTCSNTFPLVLPGIHKYLNIIKQIEIAEGRKVNQAHRESAQSSALKDDLAQHNAYFFAKFILNFIESEFRTNLGRLGRGDLSLQFENNFSRTKEAILKELKTITGADSKLLDELRNRFKSVELDMAAERRKGY